MRSLSGTCADREGAPLARATAPDCRKDKASNVEIDLVDENPFHLIGTFPGPPDTPYQGGRFSVVRAARLRVELNTASFNAMTVRLGHCNTRLIPIPAGEDEVHHVRLVSSSLFLGETVHNPSIIPSAGRCTTLMSPRHLVPSAWISSKTLGRLS